ncbi:hypothetical protein AGMMS49531_09270 [Endomicrobiia bacterium]|nr:hypothetical protein AGMMS49531_09270 [Endomicrobiia bacterium]
MKKLNILLVALFMLFVTPYSYAAKKEVAPSHVVNATVNGKSFRGVSAYRVSAQTKYFSVREVAELYNATLEWKPVSLQVTMNFGNRKIDIKANSTEVVFGRKSKKMSLPSRLIKNDIYISPEVITSMEFSDITGTDTVWNPSSLLLNVTRKADTSAVKRPNINDAMQNDNQRAMDLTPPEKYGQAHISEIVSVIENSEDNKDLEKVPVAKFESDNIIDDSCAIVDDAVTIASKNKKKHHKHKKIVVLDAGHGGKDPGTIGHNGTKEKDMNLEIMRELKLIFDKDDDYEIVLTRKDDTFISLVERPNIANEHNADLFISVHCNGDYNKNANGFEIFFLSENATDSQAAATASLENSVLELEGKPSNRRSSLQNILWSMIATEYMNESAELSGFIAAETPSRLGIRNRGVKQANFYVLRGTQMPAVLVECAFLTNYNEEAKLRSKKFRATIPDSIYQGVVKYYEKKAKEQNNK